MKSTNSKSIRRSLVQMLNGTMLTEEFFLKNRKFIFTFVGIILLQITTRYAIIDRITYMNELQTELKTVEAESLTIAAQLISVSRSTRVKELVKKHEIGLEEPKSPIYKLKK